MQNTPLKSARENRGESHAQVAKSVGIDPSHLSRLESGEKRASPELANRLALYFGNAVTRDQILFPEDYEMAPAARKPIRSNLAEAKEA